MFMEKILKQIEQWEKLEKILDLDNFENIYWKDKGWRKKHEFEKIKSASALRKVYDAYLDIYDKDNYKIEKQIWIAKVAYQEKRKILPDGFTKFIKWVINKLSKEDFKKFLEVFVAYHKYFNPQAK